MKSLLFAIVSVALGIASTSAQSVQREPGYLGLVIDDRSENGRGVRVIEAVRGGPAELAGLQAGDLITSIGSAAVRGIPDFMGWMREAPAGAKVAIQFDRAGATRQIEAVLGSRPASAERRFPDFGRIGAQPSREPPRPGDAAPSYPNAPSGPPQPAGSEIRPQTQPPLVMKKPVDDASRVELLERRVQELEQRIVELERALRTRP